MILVAVVAATAGAGVTLAVPSVKAQATYVATTSSGVRVEEVKVGTSCVVVLSRVGAGTSDDIAAVPCR
jgi:hypothetical protein